MRHRRLNGWYSYNTNFTCRLTYVIGIGNNSLFLYSSSIHTFMSVCLSVCYVAVRTIVLLRVLSHHIVDFPGSRRMETAPTSIEVLLGPTLVQSDEPSDLRGSLSPTTRHRCTHVLVYTAPGTGSPRRSPYQLWTGSGVALTSVIEPKPMS